jgi:hypothetical protein
LLLLLQIQRHPKQQAVFTHRSTIRYWQRTTTERLLLLVATVLLLLACCNSTAGLW